MIRALAFLSCLIGSPISAQCRQALALGLDVSGSVDAREYRFQLDGLANALRNPKVEQAMLSNPLAPIRLAVFEWSESSHQRLLIDWTEIQTRADLNGVITRLAGTQRSNAPRGTAVGAAMGFGAGLLAAQGDCWKKTLDLSGDGKHNLNPHPRDVKAGLLASGITINGLAIGADDPHAGDTRYVQIGELTAYYSAWVILGPNAFVEVALGFEDYEDAMTRKLLKELEGLVLSDAASQMPRHN